MTAIALLLIAVSLGFLLYVIVGYPLLLGWLARRAPQPIRKDGPPRPLSVLIAVHNGAHYIGAKLDSILALEYPLEMLDVIVISDGSTDQTEEIVRRYPWVRLLTIPKSGKCAALNAGFGAARHDLLLLTDVRQVLESSSVRRLIACFADERVGVVSGNLVIRRGQSTAEEDVGLYWRYESWIRHQLGLIDSFFGATGPFYAMRRSLYRTVPSDILLDDVYLPLGAFFRGYRSVVEESATAYDYPTSLQTEFRRKVRTLAGNYQIIQAYPALLGPGNRLWLHFVSYKLGRLLLPFALIAILIASVLLPAPWCWLLLAGQALFYGCALIDPVLPQNFPLKRGTSLVRTFVTMMAAALFALSIFFVPPQSLWKVTSTSAPEKLA